MAYLTNKKIGSLYLFDGSVLDDCELCPVCGVSSVTIGMYERRAAIA